MNTPSRPTASLEVCDRVKTHPGLWRLVVIADDVASVSMQNRREAQYEEKVRGPLSSLEDASRELVTWLHQAADDLGDCPDGDPERGILRVEITDEETEWREALDRYEVMALALEMVVDISRGVYRLPEEAR